MLSKSLFIASVVTCTLMYQGPKQEGAHNTPSAPTHAPAASKAYVPADAEDWTLHGEAHTLDAEADGTYENLIDIEEIEPLETLLQWV